MVSKKFTDEDDEPVAVKEVEEVPVDDVTESSEEESSEDEAPEEEDVSIELRKIKLYEIEKLKIEVQRQLIAKLKRREKALKLQKQHEEKMNKKLDPPLEDEIPDLLPDELLSLISEPNTETPSKRINFQEDPKEIRKQLKKQRLAQLKQLRKINNKSVKKGPVTVTVLKQTDKIVNQRRVLSVPVGENKVINKRDKWLKRKSLHKQRV